MKKQISEGAGLAPRKIDLEFYCKNAEVAYDPTNKFYRVTFDFSFEKEVYDFIESFISLVITDDKQKDFGALPSDPHMTGLYFGILSDFESLGWDRYSSWYYGNRSRLLEKTHNVIINAINQENTLKIKDLEFFCWVSLASLFASITEEYFHTHFEKLSIMRGTLKYHIGKTVEAILSEILEDKDTDKMRNEKTAAEKRKIQPLINRYVLVYNDIAELNNVEKFLISKDERIGISAAEINGLLQALSDTAAASKNISSKGGVKYAAGDFAMVKIILYDKKDFKRFLNIIKKDRDLKQKLTESFEAGRVRKKVMDIISASGSGRLLNMIKHREAAADVFHEAKVKKYLFSALKDNGGKKAKELMAYIDEAEDRIKRSRNNVFGTLLRKELEKIAWHSLEIMSLYFKTASDFKDIRKKYGKKSAFSEQMQGIKILRQSVIKRITSEEIGMDEAACVSIPDDEKTRIENHFEEAGLFYFREQGAAYPGGQGSARGRKIFMFADLRNSTETTMKLTKDTASFLTPYLNTVYKLSKENAGTEIYFAGDGYAAHYPKAADCVRAACVIHREYTKLRKDAEMKAAEKSKEIFKELMRLGALSRDKKPAILVKIEPSMADEIKEALAGLNVININVDELVSRIAEEYSMPKVEIGIGVTEGELFFAVIGEEQVRFNIVLSPSLTQAARLSGSNGDVKKYLEKLYGTKAVPRRVYVHERKLFNQGIVITNEIYNALRRESEVDIIPKEKLNLSYDIHYYYDGTLNRYVCMSKMEQGVALKGIEKDVEVFEVFASGSQVDVFVNNWINEQKKQG